MSVNQGCERERERARATKNQQCRTGKYWGDCDDCDDHYREKRDYMVTDEIWDAIGAQQYGTLLCLRCVERRLGRRLVPDDFPRYPINEGL